MDVTPTLHFAGQCEEAIRVYREAFGLHVNFLLRYSDADARDWATPLTAEQRGLVYHCEAMIGARRLMLADEMEPANALSSAIFLTITFDIAEEVRKAFDVLVKEGGRVFYPLHSTTYSSCCGSVVDRFGVRWGLMTEQTER